MKVAQWRFYRSRHKSYELHTITTFSADRAEQQLLTQAQAQQAAIPRLKALGLSVAQIAEALGLSVAEVGD
jgi:DNA-binding NarL/FixJ family response regulator